MLVDYWSTLCAHAPYFMCYDITCVSNVCITCQSSMVAGCQRVAQKTWTVPGILVFCLLPQAFFSRLTDDKCLQRISNTHMRWQKLLTYTESIQYRNNFFSSLVQPPSAPSTIIHDRAKGAYDWNGKILATNKKSLEEGQSLYGQRRFYKYRS